MSDAKYFIKGDSDAIAFTLTSDAVIVAPSSASLLLYERGSASPAVIATIPFVVDSGAGSTSVTGHVHLTPANTPAAGTYSVQISLSYAGGAVKTWPNTTAWTLKINNPGAA